MTKIKVETINFYDFKLSLPFFLKGDETTTLKIPANDINSAFSILEKLLLISVDYVIEIQIYSISKTVGNTRVDYKLQQRISGTILDTWKLQYKRKFKKSK